jgi:hypothetical protein
MTDGVIRTDASRPLRQRTREGSEMLPSQESAETRVEPGTESIANG